MGILEKTEFNYFESIDTEVLNRSIKEAKFVLRNSPLLDEVKELNYNYRRNSFSDFISEKGYEIFSPYISDLLAENFKEQFHEAKKIIMYDYWESLEDEQVASLKANLFSVASLLYEHISANNILKNTIPIEVIEKIESYSWPNPKIYPQSLKNFSSPKLSKLISKLIPEDHPFTGWYTNSCCKSANMGIDEDHKIVLSVLPHHIAGMSYYSCFNFGGKAWNSYSGTSCQDPLINPIGDEIPSLVASIQDETLAIAYLTKSENKDIFNPIYEARALFRIIELKNGKTLIILLRQFGYEKSKSLLIEGMRNKFEGRILINDDIYAYKKNMKNEELIQEHIEMTFNVSPCFNFKNEGNHKCFFCEGLGYVDNWSQGEEETKSQVCCPQCDGTGLVDSGIFYPYNDDYPLWNIYGSELKGKLAFEFIEEKKGKRIIYQIPSKLLMNLGLIENRKEVTELKTLPIQSQHEKKKNMSSLLKNFYDQL